MKTIMRKPKQNIRKHGISLQQKTYLMMLLYSICSYLLKHNKKFKLNIFSYIFLQIN